MKNLCLDSELRSVFVEILNVNANRLELDQDFRETVCIDSLDSLRLLTEIEVRFDVEFSEHQLSELRTLRQLIEAIENISREESSCESD